MEKTAFLSHFGDIFEHSPWIAENAFDAGASGTTLEATHAALCEAFRHAGREQQHAVLCAHPDLAGKLTTARTLTAASTQEQASAGLDALNDDERAIFLTLNSRYKEKFGFPFIIAVKGLDKTAILDAFQTRINNSHETEFSTACAQVEQIALLRLKQVFSHH